VNLRYWTYVDLKEKDVEVLLFKLGKNSEI